jgi:hypothetical protein
VVVIFHISWVLPASSTNKTDRNDITEILLKVALNNITLNPNTLLDCGKNLPFVSIFCWNVPFVVPYIDYWYILCVDGNSGMAASIVPFSFKEISA